MRLLTTLLSLFIFLSGSLCALGETAAGAQKTEVKEAKIEMGDKCGCFRVTR